MRLPCLLVALLASPALAQYTLATERFEVLFPEAPTPEERVQSTPLGTLTTRSWTLTLDADTWVLAVTEYPRAVVARFGATGLLATARDQAVATVNGTLERDEAVELEPHVPWAPFPGREFHARSPVGAQLTARVYLVGAAVYQLVRVRLARSTDEASFQVFTGSFRIRPAWPRAPAPR